MTVDKIFIAISKKDILKSTKSHSHISKAYSHISKVPICNLLYGSTIKDFSVFLRFEIQSNDFNNIFFPPYVCVRLLACPDSPQPVL